MDISFILNHLGEERDEYYGSVAPPIFQTTNFCFKTVGEMREKLTKELETPFYIVRSAVLSSALRFFTKEGTHLRLMLSDEAFAKMDESRRRAVIRYLRQALKVQFIVAMPTSNSGSVKPEFEKEFTFAKVPAILADGREWKASEVQERISSPKPCRGSGRLRGTERQRALVKSSLPRIPARRPSLRECERAREAGVAARAHRARDC